MQADREAKAEAAPVSFAGSQLLVDAKVIHELCALLSPEQTSEIYRSFFRHTGQRLQQMVTLQNSGDIAREAHSLKGTASMLGAVELSEIAAGLEAQPVCGAALGVVVERMAASLDRLAGAVCSHGVRL